MQTVALRAPTADAALKAALPVAEKKAETKADGKGKSKGKKGKGKKKDKGGDSDEYAGDIHDREYPLIGGGAFSGSRTSLTEPRKRSLMALEV